MKYTERRDERLPRMLRKKERKNTPANLTVRIVSGSISYRHPDHLY